MPKLTDTLVRMLAPQPHTPPPTGDYVPPALSAAGQAAPPALTSARNNGNGKQQQPTPAGHRMVSQRAPQPLEWQRDAWAYYRRCGEARQAVDWIAHGLSRFNLYIGKIDQDGSGDPEPMDDPGKAGEILTELCDGQIGQRGMLHRLGIHLLVPGESWLVGYPAPPPAGSRAARDGNRQADHGTTWSVLSRREWEDGDAGRVRLKLPEDPRAVAGDHWVTFEPSETVVVPIYLPDPEDATYATSAFESAMGPLEELDGLDRRVGADINSRLAGAGVLAIPESATMPTPQSSDGANPLNGDPFVEALTRAMSTAIADPNSASAVTPICVKVADESLAKMQHQTFSTPFDAQVPPLREGTRERVAATMDVPKEVVTGIEDLNHWSAWATTDDAVRTHIGPLAALICDNITRKILWPALRQDGNESDVEGVCVWWDASEVVLRPDRSTEALTAYKEGLISGRAARRELAFSEDDAPEEPEQPQPSENDDQDQDGQPPPPAPSESDDEQPSGGQSEPGQRPEPPNEREATERDREAQPQT